MNAEPESRAEGEAAASARQALIGAVLDHLAPGDLLGRRDIETALIEEIEAAGLHGLEALRQRLQLDAGWAYYPHDPLARRIHHRLADRVLLPGSSLTGATAALAELADRPLIVCANHLSYADANVIELLLHRAGQDGASMAKRLTAIAGPKVYSSRERRFSSLCFGTIKVPQSSGLASEEAVLSPREVARASRVVIAIAHERLAAGDALILFGEGRRSREATMQRMLSAVARYLEAPDCWLLPVGLVGSDALYPLDRQQPQPAQVSLSLGQPIAAPELLAAVGRDRQVAMDAVGLAIAALLPPDHRGVYVEAARYPEAATALTRISVPDGS